MSVFYPSGLHIAIHNIIASGNHCQRFVCLQPRVPPASVSTGTFTTWATIFPLSTTHTEVLSYSVDKDREKDETKEEMESDQT